MAVQVTPLAPGLPATTAIQDPAVRQFANAVADILRTSQTAEGAVAQLSRAAGALSKGSGSAAPPAISQWLYSSELYQRLSGAIERVDTSAQEAIVAEALARAQAITAAQGAIERVDTSAQEAIVAEALARAQAITAAQGALQTQINLINADLENISQTPAYDAAETYAAGDLVTYEGGLYRALQETTGNAPTSATHWEKVGDYASLGEAVAAHALQLADHETRVTSAEGAITAEAEARTLLATQVGANTAAIQAEAQTRTTETEALSTQITTLSATVDDNAAAIQSEATARADADGALAESITTVVANYQAADAATLTSAEGYADSAAATALATAQAVVQAEATARADADGALATQITTVASATGVNAAAIVTEAETRTTNDLAIVQALDTLWSISGASKALSQDNKNLITNWQTATAQEWETLQAEVLDAGGNTLYAAVAAESQARSDFEGKVAASWMVKAEVDVGTGKSYVAGIALGAEGQGDSATSEFLVRADKFALVMPGYGEHVPFAIGNFGPEFSGLTSWSNVQGVGKPADGADVTSLNTAAAISGQGAFATLSQIDDSNVTTYIANAAIGTAQIGNAAITSAKIANATILTANIANAAITNAKIGNASVDTLQIAGNAVTIPVGANGTTSATTAAVSFGGAPVIIIASGCGTNQNQSPGNATLSIYRNSTLLKTYDIGPAYSGDIGFAYSGVFAAGAITYVDAPGTEAVTYTVQLVWATKNASCAITAIGARR